MRLKVGAFPDVEANFASVTNGYVRDSGIFQIPRHAFSMSTLHKVVSLYV